MTSKQERWYQDALTAYANGNGDRYNTQSKHLTWCAASLRKPSDEVLSDLAGLMEVTPHDADLIKRGIDSAAKKIGASPEGTSTFKPQKDNREGFPFIVPDYIRSGGGEAGSDSLRTLSPFALSGIKSNPREQTALFLASLWHEDELLFVKARKRERGLPGKNILPRSAWDGHTLIDRDCLYRNALSGQQGKTTGGEVSYTSADCIASPMYALLEFDHLPLRQQVAFWLGFLKKSNLAPRLVSLVWSGGKSIHGMLRIKADNLTAPSWASYLRDRFASNPDPRFCADKCGFLPHGGTRLAGARRTDNGSIQQLLYLAKPSSK